MALGRPVVANDRPEQKLVLERSCGGICVPYSEEAFAAGAVAIMTQPDATRAMGERGRHYVEQHRTYRQIAEALEERYLALARQTA
ncbi:MAG: glycosyltransferase [Gammaproteobacteria bacterium]|nr:glycosyltransferase [Gammaproteobacteria bacterium]